MMMGPGTMGPGMMGMMNPSMMGPMMGMMHPGIMGFGMMGPCGVMMGAQQTNLNLSVSDVKGQLQSWVSMMGNSRVKVGSVSEKDSNTIVADVVTAEKEVLVQRFSVDRHTGVWQSVQ